MSWQERPYAGGSYEGGGWRFTDHPLSWAPTLFRVFGIRVRIHILFILFVAFEVLQGGADFLYVAQYLSVLFGSVFLHELGHCFAARRVGGRADEVLMWPLGGLAMVDAPRRPWPQFVTVICGPLVNVALFAATAALIAAGLFGRRSVPFDPFSGWEAAAATWGNPRLWVRLIFQINWILFLFNLWPMYPMDGGRLLHAALWWRLGVVRATAMAGTVGMVAAVLLGFYGLLHGQYLLLAIAFMGYTTCHQEKLLARTMMSDENESWGFEGTGGFTTLPATRARRPGLVARLRARWANARRREAEARLEANEHEVDRILDKVHRLGIQSLTQREKRALKQATQKQQSSRESQWN